MAGDRRAVAFRFVRRDVAGGVADRRRADPQRRTASFARAAVALNLRVVFAGGGTGGHIYPALAIDDALRAAGIAGYTRLYYGKRDGLEATLVRAIPLRFIPCAPLVRSRSPRVLLTVAVNAAGILVALAALLRDRPDVVVATGGYVCFPVLVAARLARLLGLSRARSALLEINARPGLTNRLAAPLADERWLTYEATRTALRGGIVTGTPVRASLRTLPSAADGRRALGLDPERTTVVVMGGSQGARSINEAVLALVAGGGLSEDRQLLLVAGRRDIGDLERRWPAVPQAKLVAYLDDPRAAYAAADVVVARAGASTLGELAATGRPSILVPYPYAAAGHQDDNAAVFVAAGAARRIADADLRPERLAAELHAVLEPATHAAMRRAAAGLARPDAGLQIVERITALARARVVHSRGPKRVSRD